MANDDGVIRQPARADTQVMPEVVLVKRSADDYSLAELAEQVVNEVRAAHKARSAVLIHVRNAGDCLNEAKRRVLDEKGHGHWLAWLDEHCGLDHSTAQYYMAIAEHWRFFREKTDRDPQMLTVREARVLLKDIRAAAKAGLTDVPVRMKKKVRKPRLTALADQIRRYDQHRFRARRQALIELREAIDAVLEKWS